MNIGILGGGGIRSPIIIKMLSNFNFKEPIREVRIFDINSKKTDAIIKLASALLSRSGNNLQIIRCNAIEEFADDLDAAIFTIREGFEKRRAIDERICLKHNIIGQETTGAAGFSFASRSIPALINYADQIKKKNNACILINFTNPAGIVVRALNLAGHKDVIGICDSADAARIHAGEFFGKNRFGFISEIAGLNHFSWTTKLVSDNKDILSDLLNNEKFYELAHGPFNKELFKRDGMLKNEYLYYYYCTEEALKGMLEEKETRGEYLLRKNEELINNLLREEDPERLIDIYEAYLNDRFRTYMSYAYTRIKRRVVENESEGYAEIALKIIEALKDNNELNIPLILPNEGTLSFLPDEYVIEKFCSIKNREIRSRAITSDLPEYVKNLIINIAEYEESSAQSIINKSFTLARKALSIHPLVGEQKADKILKEIIDSNSEYFKDYK